MEKFHCVRVYANGEAKETVRDRAGMENWMAYNRTFRGGNALFVNGVCEHKDHGYLSDESINLIAQTLKAELEHRVPTLPVDTIGPQVDSFMMSGTRAYTGYRPEPTHFGFRAEIEQANTEIKLREAVAIGNQQCSQLPTDNSAL